MVAAEQDRTGLAARHAASTIRTFNPSIAGISGSWQARREPEERSSDESRSSSSSSDAGARTMSDGARATWQVAQEQHPPQAARRSENPLSRIASIRVPVGATVMVRSVPERSVICNRIKRNTPCNSALRQALPRSGRGEGDEVVDEARRQDRFCRRDQLSACAALSRWDRSRGSFSVCRKLRRTSQGSRTRPTR